MTVDYDGFLKHVVDLAANIIVEGDCRVDTVGTEIDTC
jgi:hypothetical protein